MSQVDRISKPRVLRSRKVSFIFISIAALCLFFGGFIYLLFRSHNLLMFDWATRIGIIQFIPHLSFDKNNQLEAFIIYSLPDGLWQFSLITIFGVIWRESLCNFLCYSVLFGLVCLLSEIGQFYKIIPGVFDLGDIVTIVSSQVLGMFIYFVCIRRKST